jgi:(S)-mandelate dehydrogenase
MTSDMDASVNWKDVAEIRDVWPRKIVLKGLTSPGDAVEAGRHGFDAIVVPNHGGRQLDGAPATIAVLPDVVAAANGTMDVFIDGGVRRGSDVAKALCLGAQAAMIGRATLFGVAAGGQPGAERALELLRREFDRCLALLGCPRADALGSAFIRGTAASAQRWTYTVDGQELTQQNLCCCNDQRNGSPGTGPARLVKSKWGPRR